MSKNRTDKLVTLSKQLIALAGVVDATPGLQTREVLERMDALHAKLVEVYERELALAPEIGAQLQAQEEEKRRGLVAMRRTGLDPLSAAMRRTTGKGA